ncbi:hypothetical protein GCM10010295_58200 [Streptomyces intermedius]
MSGQGGPRADGAVVRCVGGAELLRVRVLTVPVVRNGSGQGGFVRAGAGTAVPCGRPERARVVRLGGAVVPGYVRLGVRPGPGAARPGRVVRLAVVRPCGWCGWCRWCVRPAGPGGVVRAGPVRPARTGGR